MKKSILNLGKALNKAEQKEINGGSTTMSRKCNVGIFTKCTREEQALAEAGDSYYICKCGLDLGDYL